MWWWGLAYNSLNSDYDRVWKIESQCQKEMFLFSKTSQMGSGTQTASCLLGTKALCLGKSGQSIKLTTNFNPVLRSRISGAILPLPSYAITAWTGATLLLLLPLWLGLYKVLFFLYGMMYMPMCPQGCAWLHIDFCACLTLTQIKGNAVVEKVIRHRLTAEVQIRYWANPCGILGGTRGIGSVFFFLLELQLSLDSIIP